MQWPPWWDWPLEVGAHIEERMRDRSFTEIDLRTMLQDADGFRPDLVEGRWVIETWWGGRAWAVIVEPDDA